MATFANKQDRSLIATAQPASAYMWPESAPNRPPLKGDDEIFVFQYWPETITDEEAPRYAEKETPGGSHPLLQWTGGTGRNISFVAHFTCEVDPELTPIDAARLLPSSRYTVDVRAAVARLKSYLRGDYVDGSPNQAAKPPKRLHLVLDNMRLGGNRDDILVVLRSAPVVYQANFPNGTPRVVEVSCTFSEVVQSASDSDGSQVKFLGRSPFETAGRDYRYRGTVDRV